jgi:hypothetical protein
MSKYIYMKETSSPYATAGVCWDTLRIRLLLGRRAIPQTGRRTIMCACDNARRYLYFAEDP